MFTYGINNKRSVKTNWRPYAQQKETCIHVPVMWHCTCCFIQLFFHVAMHYPNQSISRDCFLRDVTCRVVATMPSVMQRETLHPPWETPKPFCTALATTFVVNLCIKFIHRVPYNSNVAQYGLLQQMMSYVPTHIFQTSPILISLPIVPLAVTCRRRLRICFLARRWSFSPLTTTCFLKVWIPPKSRPACSCMQAGKHTMRYQSYLAREALQ